MTTPNKRRKKNDYQASPNANRSLDYFFGKQKDKEEAKVDISLQTANTAGENENEALETETENEDLTDEQLARKLQAEWDKQDRIDGGVEVNGSKETGEISHVEADDEPPDKAPSSTPNGNDAAALPSGADEVKPEPTSDAFAALGKKTTLALQSATAAEDTTSHHIPFDESPLTFDVQKYVPGLKKLWASEGDAATYAILTHCFVLVNSTQSRIKIVDTLVNLLRTIIEGDPESLLPAVWLATNSISPPYIDIELGLGGSAISKALKKVCGLDSSGLKTLYNKHGDAGDVAFEAKKRQSLTLRKPKPLTIKGVFDSLLKIANAKGNGSQGK